MLYDHAQTVPVTIIKKGDNHWMARIAINSIEGGSLRWVATEPIYAVWGVLERLVEVEHEKDLVLSHLPATPYIALDYGLVLAAIRHVSPPTYESKLERIINDALPGLQPFYNENYEEEIKEAAS